jgi:hypothetical protein
MSVAVTVLTFDLAERGLRVIGVDPHRASIERAKSDPRATDGTEFICGDVFTTNLQPASFDLVAASAVLHHIDARARLRRLRGRRHIRSARCARSAVMSSPEHRFSGSIGSRRQLRVLGRSLASARRSVRRSSRQALRLIPIRSSPGSQRSGARSGRHRDRGQPHSADRGSWSCMAQRALDGAAGWPRHATGPRLVFDRSPEVRTTKAHLAPAKRSRSRSRASERSKIAPVIFTVNRVSCVRSCVRSVDLGRPVATEERHQRFIDEFGIRGSGVEPTSIIEQASVNGRTDSSASHATIMP